MVKQLEYTQDYFINTGLGQVINSWDRSGGSSEISTQTYVNIQVLFLTYYLFSHLDLNIKTYQDSNVMALNGGGLCPKVGFYIG